MLLTRMRNTLGLLEELSRSLWAATVQQVLVSKGGVEMCAAQRAGLERTSEISSC